MSWFKDSICWLANEPRRVFKEWVLEQTEGKVDPVSVGLGLVIGLLSLLFFLLGFFFLFSKGFILAPLWWVLSFALASFGAYLFASEMKWLSEDQEKKDHWLDGQYDDEPEKKDG